MWYVGQKVVCVDPIAGLSKGSTYAITRIGDDCRCEAICVGLAITDFHVGDPFICNRCGFYGWINKVDREFHTSRFRPLDALTEQVERIESEGAPVELEPQYA